MLTSRTGARPAPVVTAPNGPQDRPGAEAPADRPERAIRCAAAGSRSRFRARSPETTNVRSEPSKHHRTNATWVASPGSLSAADAPLEGGPTWRLSCSRNGGAPGLPFEPPSRPVGGVIVRPRRASFQPGWVRRAGPSLALAVSRSFRRRPPTGASPAERDLARTARRRFAAWMRLIASR